MKDENQYSLNNYYDTIYSCVNIMKMFITLYSTGADLGFFKRESKIQGSDHYDVIVMTSLVR